MKEIAKKMPSRQGSTRVAESRWCLLLLATLVIASCTTNGQTQGPSAPVRATTPCVVTRISDGDTIQCEGIGRVRLIGMDTPELSQAPFGTMATEALSNILRSASEVLLEGDVEAQDNYGRTLAYVWVDSVLANWLLVRQGWAVTLTYPPNVQYVEWFEKAQRDARQEGVGLWASGGFDCLPVRHRRGECD